MSTVVHTFVCSGLHDFIHTATSCPSHLQALSAAGLGAGLTEAVVVNPFEVVKVSLQANRNAFKEVD